jgi:hypothetical protein
VQVIFLRIESVPAVLQARFWERFFLGGGVFLYCCGNGSVAEHEFMIMNVELVPEIVLVPRPVRPFLQPPTSASDGQPCVWAALKLAELGHAFYHVGPVT